MKTTIVRGTIVVFMRLTLTPLISGFKPSGLEQEVFERRNHNVEKKGGRLVGFLHIFVIIPYQCTTPPTLKTATRNNEQKRRKKNT